MATKVTGLAWSTLSVGDSSNATQDIRNAVTELDFATPRAVQDVTGIDKSAMERLLLLADYSINLKGVFDTLATNGAHAVFSTVPSTSVNRVVSITTNGKNLNMGSTGAGNGAVLFTDYKITRNANGELLFEAPGVGSTGTVPTWS
jgi:hypothetical protein